MDEAEWLRGTNPTEMLVEIKGLTSERKLRLFACACCQRITQHVRRPRCRSAFGMMEEVASGICPPHALDSARAEAVEALDEIEADANEQQWWYVEHRAAVAIVALSRPRLDQEVLLTILNMARECASFADARNGVSAREVHTQAALLREIVGNPFWPVTLDPFWLTYEVSALATGLYADRAFDRMPILADALQDAGCDNEDILNHCRQPGEHVRGCWVVDLVLGKS